MNCGMNTQMEVNLIYMINTLCTYRKKDFVSCFVENRLSMTAKNGYLLNIQTPYWYLQNNEHVHTLLGPIEHFNYPLVHVGMPFCTSTY